MKRNYRHVLFLLGLLLSLLLIGPRSYAQEIRESEPLPPFTALNVEGPVKIELIPADENKLQLMLWDLDEREIRWQVKDNTLYLIARKGLVNKRAYADVKLYYATLNHINISGGEVTTQEPIQCPHLTLTAESSIGKMELIAECKEITILTSGDNTVKVRGTTEQASYQAKLGSRIQCLELSAQNVLATASGKAEIQLQVSDQLDARSVTGANIFFRGDPVTLNIKKSTLGGVESVNNL